jgi:hypothetical protein
MAPSFEKLQTEELRIWTLQRNAEPDEKPDSIQQMEKQLRSSGIEKSGVIYAHLNPFFWVLSINIENFENLVILRISPA